MKIGRLIGYGVAVLVALLGVISGDSGAMIVFGAIAAAIALGVAMSGEKSDRATEDEDPATWDALFDGTEQVTWSTQDKGTADRAVAEGGERGYEVTSTSQANGRERLIFTKRS